MTGMASLLTEPGGSLYDRVREQLTELVHRFGLGSSSRLIMETYDDICRDSLAIPRGVRPGLHSRINRDGTPIQYAVTVGPACSPVLQFLGEAGSAGTVGIERIRANRACLASVARRIGASVALSQVVPLLDVLAPETDRDLLADAAGAYWIGVAFAPQRDATLKIYINGRWGGEKDRWARLGGVADSFRASSRWRRVAGDLPAELHPLGSALTLTGSLVAGARVYLDGYGILVPRFVKLAEACGGRGFGDQVRDFGHGMLGEDYVYPTQTAVCSFGFGPTADVDFKLELCAHRFFRSDHDAATRLAAWFHDTGQDAAPYGALLDVLAEGRPSTDSVDLHCYVGIGQRHGSACTTVYMKPALALE